MSRGFDIARPGNIFGFGHLGGFGVASSVPGGMPVLAATGTSDLHLVADDWSGSGNWASRLGGYTATVTGAPTRSATTQFPGRYEIGGFTTTAAFRLPANAAHTVQTNDTITYEWIIKTPSSFSTLQTFGGYVSTGASQIFNIGYISSAGGNLESAVYNSAVAVYLGTAGIAGAWQMGAKYNLFSLVMDIAAPRYEVYINGASVFTDTTTAGSLSPTNTDFGIGARWSAPAAGFQNPLSLGATVMEVMRHREAFSDATVAARAATFNTLKGY